jgi:Domain of unknown function (DUF4382)
MQSQQVVLTAVIIGAAVTYNPSVINTSNQQTNIAYTSQIGQASSSPSGGSSASTLQGTSIQGGSGVLNILLTDAPPSSLTLKYILVNVSSVELRYEGIIASTTSATTTSSTTSSSSTSSSSTSSATTSTSVTTTTTTSGAGAPQNAYVFDVPSSVGMNVNLTSLRGQSALLGAPKVPAGNITAIIINITGAKAVYTDGSSAQLKVVANGMLMVPIQFAIQANESTDLTIDITPNLVHISPSDVLTPVIHVTSVERGPTST